MPTRDGGRLWRFTHSARSPDATIATLLLVVATLVIVFAAVLAFIMLPRLIGSFASAVAVLTAMLFAIAGVAVALFHSRDSSRVRRRELLVHPEASRAVLCEMRGHRVIWSHEDDLSAFEFVVQPFTTDTTKTPGGCVSVRYLHAPNTPRMILAMTRTWRFAMAYAQTVLDSIGVAWRETDVRLTITDRALDMTGLDDAAVLEPFRTCVGCGYDLRGLSVDRCPECGCMRALVPVLAPASPQTP
ncbi:MAG: hypothetical protein KF768_05920 [Phycisphaeraceae bacterium]|nr:hypothetical protein [Phycisphaeraceae bacterium]